MLSCLVDISPPETEPLIERKAFSDDIVLVQSWLAQLYERINALLFLLRKFELDFCLPNRKHFDQYKVLSIGFIYKIKTFYNLSYIPLYN